MLAVFAFASPAFADNCGSLSDCSFGIKIALVVAAIALVVLLVVLLPEIIGPACGWLPGARIGDLG